MKGKLLLAGAMCVAMYAMPAYAKDSKDVTIVLSENVDMLDPCMSTRSNIGRVILENISETLTELDVRGDKGVMPRLAKSWEEVNDTTWRFHLREGVKFSDGSAFDAQDVKHSFERTFSDKNSCEVSRYFGGIKVTPKIIDEHTIDFTTDPAQPILPLMMSLLTIVPSDTPMEFTRNPVGTGPYKLTEWKPGQQIVLTRRDDYWGKKPAVEQATYVSREDSTVRAAMVAKGEADIAPLIAMQDATDPKMDIAYPNSETFYLRIDNAMAPLNDKRVREALNLAVDRDAFIGTLLPKGVQKATAIVPPTTLGWNPDIKVPAYDPDKAKKLLAEAKADGVPVDTQITLVGRTDNFPNVTEVLEALRAMYEDVGLNVKLKMYEVAEFENNYSKPYPENRGPQLVAAQHDNGRGDPVFSMYFKYDSKGRQSGISDPHVDDLIARATAATGDERKKLWSELFAYLHDDVVADVLLFHMVGFARVNPRIDFTPTIATNSQLQLSEIGFK
ncbi:peptide ABC transporter substrate-binding protein [Thalassospira profundimaris]|uniref:Peptide ABC transporter substrate-binding protein n=1 Tax=Thalassospira profundimaris TaxID=502049 RepID=A0A367XAW6_9PROT|nr:ABC transporter substrate-binding protein [Thalassospira profundimaris]RCK50805.1 peptide ABC transporter substrate-binding protein [Thalassospira profundimaris]